MISLNHMEPSNRLKDYVPLLVISGAVVIALFISSRNNEPAPTTNNVAAPVEERSANAGYESQIDSQGIINVTVTPLQLGAESSEWKFNIVLDTHSGSLDEDMLASAVLVDDNNKQYRPTNWEGAPPGGHHREGVLTFMPSILLSQAVQLKIVNVGVPERNFTWTLK
jgi:hypothetical protein